MDTVLDCHGKPITCQSRVRLLLDRMEDFCRVFDGVQMAKACDCPCDRPCRCHRPFTAYSAAYGSFTYPMTDEAGEVMGVDCGRRSVEVRLGSGHVITIMGRACLLIDQVRPTQPFDIAW